MVALIVGGAAVLLASPLADAHALLVSADPGDGVSLGSSPRAVTLEFTEEPDPKLSSIKVLDPGGGSHERGSPAGLPNDARALRVDVDSLDRGVYTVSWRVVSRVDGHLTAGAYAFGVQVSPSEIEQAEVAEPVSPPLSPGESAGRFLFYAGLVVAVGSAWVGWFLFSAPGNASRLLMLGSVVTLGGVGTLAIAQQRAAGAPWDAFIGTPIGRALVERGVFVVVVAVAAGWLLRSGEKGSRAASLIAIAAGLGAITVHVGAGHAGTGSLATVKVATQLVHFAAVAVWIGGLAGLLAGIRGVPDETKARAVRRFSAVAGIALAAVVGAGTARAVSEVGSWRALVETGYGRIVVAKVVLLGVLAALGARNRWWNVPRGAEGFGNLRRVSRVELSVAAVVLALASVLSSLVPARSARLAEPTSVSLEGTDFARSVRIQLEITPGFPGANLLHATVDPLRGPRSIRAVRLRLSSPEAGIEGSTLTLRRSNERWSTRTAAVAVPGTWRVVVLVDRGAESVEIPLRFHTRCRASAPPTGRPRITDIELPGGGSVQAYADPGEPGTNEIHFTFFDERGKELPVADGPRIEGSRTSSKDLRVRRFSAGHFVAGGHVSSGEWIFTFDGETAGGDPLNVCFSDEVR